VTALDEALPGAAELQAFCAAGSSGRGSAARFGDTWVATLAEAREAQQIGFLLAAALLGADNAVAKASEALLPRAWPALGETQAATLLAEAGAVAARLCEGRSDALWRLGPLAELPADEGLERAADAFFSAAMGAGSTQGARRFGAGLIRARFPFFGDPGALEAPGVAGLWSLESFFCVASRRSALAALRRASAPLRAKMACAALLAASTRDGPRLPRASADHALGGRDAQRQRAAWAVAEAVGVERALAWAAACPNPLPSALLASSLDVPPTRGHWLAAAFTSFFSRRDGGAQAEASAREASLANRLRAIGSRRPESESRLSVEAVARFEPPWALRFFERAETLPAARAAGLAIAREEAALRDRQALLAATAEAAPAAPAAPRGAARL
jgi:hypothetical protein